MKAILFIIGLLALLVVACTPVPCTPVPCEAVPCEPTIEPIDTTTKSLAFGLEQTGINCAPPYVFESTVDDTIGQDEFGYYGNRDTFIINDTVRIIGYYEIIECKEIISATSGRILYSLWFDPNNQWIRKLSCSELVSPDCPDDIQFLPYSQNPNYEDYINLI